MNSQTQQSPPAQNPTSLFLISAIAECLRIFLTPAYFILRSDMGIRQSAFFQVIIIFVMSGVCMGFLAMTSAINRQIVMLFACLMLVGYVRNALQARHRRKVRDWSVRTWSTGTSLCEPVLLFVGRRVYRKWGGVPYVERMVNGALKPGFVYYYAEPALMLLLAAALWSIGSSLCVYPVFVAGGLVAVRNERELSLYLRAHEIMDAKAFEELIRAQLEDPAAGARGRGRLARIPPAPAVRPASDDQSVFERLSPELQLLLIRDGAERH